MTITESGRAAIDALFPRQVGIETELLAGLGEDRARVADALALLARVLEDGTARRLRGTGRDLGLGLSTIRPAPSP